MSDDPHKKPEYYVYKLIETLLPKAHSKLPGDDKPKPKAAQKTLVDVDNDRRLKMVELWAPDDTPRKSWLKVCKI